MEAPDFKSGEAGLSAQAPAALPSHSTIALLTPPQFGDTLPAQNSVVHLCLQGD
jgi:hypothetical protein